MQKENVNQFVFRKREQGARIHLPVSLVIDKSASTERIRDTITTCTQNLIEKFREDIVLRGIVEVQIVYFSGQYQPAEFHPLNEITPESLVMPKSFGTTNTGAALLYALRRLDEKKAEWQNAGEEYFQPYLFLLTDGYPTAGEGAPPDVKEDVRINYENAAKRIRKAESEDEKKLVFIAAGIHDEEGGYEADMEKLRELSAHHERIISVKHGENWNSIEKFFDLMYEMTGGMSDDTPPEVIIASCFGSYPR